ncbi:MAG: NAD-dependent epimerase/dehydratase family protein [Candidatus Hydrogenedentes bacterium]|nr:NAD-dependent epimerase/dehydratase family protein [Candidatus Hydrogenedentota bacterium]
MKTILITGGAGFVGAHLALALKRHREDTRVLAFDNLKRRGAELSLARLRAGGVEFVHGDVRCWADLEGVGGIDALIECSAEPSVLAGFGDAPNYLLDTNLGGALNCLELARRHAAAFVFLSTSRVYPIRALSGLLHSEAETRFELAPEQIVAGASADGINENFPLAGARSLYGATKLSAEIVLQEYAAMYGMPAVIDRCGVLTGPWQMGKTDQGVIVLWAARHCYGGSLQYIGYGGTGKQVRDILHIGDLTDLVLRQLDHIADYRGEIFNVGGGRPVSVSLLELTGLCEQLTGKSIPITSTAEKRPADIPLYLSDTGKVRAACNWQPRRGVEETLEEIVRWLRDEESALRGILAP